MAIINEVSIRRKLQSAVQAKKFIDVAYEKADEKFENNKNKLASDFEEHTVTKELRYGGFSNNSKLISKGNLFSFLGFYKSDNPASTLKNYLLTNITMNDKKPIIKVQPDKVIFGFKVKVPSKNQINTNELFKTPDEWSSRSWIQIVEEGVGNAAKYIFWSLGFGKDSPSRSKTGLQLTNGKNATNPASFKPMLYISELLENFRNRFGK